MGRELSDGEAVTVGLAVLLAYLVDGAEWFRNRAELRAVLGGKPLPLSQEEAAQRAAIDGEARELRDVLDHAGALDAALSAMPAGPISEVFEGWRTFAASADPVAALRLPDLPEPIKAAPEVRGALAAAERWQARQPIARQGTAPVVRALRRWALRYFRETSGADLIGAPSAGPAVEAAAAHPAGGAQLTGGAAKVQRDAMAALKRFGLAKADAGKLRRADASAVLMQHFGLSKTAAKGAWDGAGLPEHWKRGGRPRDGVLNLRETFAEWLAVHYPAASSGPKVAA